MVTIETRKDDELEAFRNIVAGMAERKMTSPFEKIVFDWVDMRTDGKDERSLQVVMSARCHIEVDNEKYEEFRQMIRRYEKDAVPE